MDIYKTELFPYIEGGQLNGKQFELTIKSVSEDELPNHKGLMEKKYVVHFKETEKGLVLNKTNAKTIINLYGRETNDWAGKRVTLYAEKVKAFGEMHNAVRVKAPVAAVPEQSTATPNDDVFWPDAPTADPSPMDEIEAAASEAK